MMFIILCMPNITDAGIYLLTSKRGWTGFDLSLNWLIAAILYTATMMYIINVMKKLNLRLMFVFSCITLVVFSFLFFRFIYYERLTFTMMFTLCICANFLMPLADEMTMILVVGRMSSRCPPGIEGFATSSIAALTNFAGMISGLFGAKLLYIYEVRNDDYSHLDMPAWIVVAYTTATVFLSPFLAK